jgi:hypothetical protein
VVPSTHCVATTMTPVGNSSLRHFLSSLQAMIFVAICVDIMILLMMIPCVPWSMLYFFFISSASAFAFVLSSRNCARSMHRDGSPVMCAMSSTSIKTFLSNHISPPCVTAINCLTQLFVYCPLPKCGSSSRPKIPIFSNLVAH